jgi:hypothetical protein
MTWKFGLVGLTGPGHCSIVIGKILQSGLTAGAFMAFTHMHAAMDGDALEHGTENKDPHRIHWTSRPDDVHHRHRIDLGDDTGNGDLCFPLNLQ